MLLVFFFFFNSSKSFAVKLSLIQCTAGNPDSNLAEINLLFFYLSIKNCISKNKQKIFVLQAGIRLGISMQSGDWVLFWEEMQKYNQIKNADVLKVNAVLLCCRGNKKSQSALVGANSVP